MAQMFSIDTESVREILSDLVDCLADIGFNVPQENFNDNSGNMQRFLSSMDNLEPVEAWGLLTESIKKLATDVNGDKKAISYLKVAYEDLKKCITYED